ncbi:hypothetical protein [Luteolibacter algae]
MMAFPETSQPLHEFWMCVADFMRSGDMLPDKLRLSQIAGHPEHMRSERGLSLSPEEVAHVIADRRLDGFHVDTGYTNRSLDFNYTTLTDGSAAHFTHRVEPNTKAPDDWSALIAKLLSRWPSIGAWQYFNPYQAWQWANVKYDSYDSMFGAFPPSYRTFTDLDYDEKTSVGPPRIFIDISKNPGRPRSLRPDIRFSPINFFPTAEMWLGPHFWQYAKCTKEEALASDFFIEKRDTPHYLYLKCWPEAFTRPDGEQGRMQQRLWKLLFHEDCEWPPGSGTICDEPMYGPPELMPAEADQKSKIVT